MSEKKGATLARADIGRLLTKHRDSRDIATLVNDFRDLASTALGLMDERDEAVRLWEHRIGESRDKNQQIVLGDMAWKVLIERAREQRDTAEARIQELLADNANAGGSIDDLQARLRTAEARCAALEEGLREAVAEAHGHGLVRDHPDLFDYCPDRMCAEARALLTERRENTDA